MKSLSGEARKNAGPARSSATSLRSVEALAPADGVGPLEDVSPLVQVRLGEREPGRQRVDPDAGRPQFARHGPGEPDDPALAGDVGHEGRGRLPQVDEVTFTTLP